MDTVLKRILKTLDIPYVEIPYGVYIKYDLKMIKKKYKSLIKQYHPDNSSNTLDRKFKEEKATEINLAMDTLLLMIKNNEVFIPNSPSKSNNRSNNVRTDYDENFDEQFEDEDLFEEDQFEENQFEENQFEEEYDTYNESNDFKEENSNNSSNINSDIDNLIDEIDRLKKLVNSKVKLVTDIQKYKIISNSVNYLENIKDLLTIYIERNEKFDYWDFINYIDLFYYYFNQTLNVSSAKYNKELNYKFKNDI